MSNQVTQLLMEKYVNLTLAVSAAVFAWSASTLGGLFFLVINPFTVFDHSKFFLIGSISFVLFVASLADIVRGLTVVMVVEKLLTRDQDSV